MLISVYRYPGQLRQSVTITGWDGQLFGDSVESILAIYAIFNVGFCEGKLDPWQPKQFLGKDALELWNRYFSPRRRLLDPRSVPFHELIDPEAVLSNIEARENETLVHTAENEVKYYELFANGEEISRFRPKYYFMFVHLLTKCTDFLLRTRESFELET
jgi:hypothetical protein